MGATRRQNSKLLSSGIPVMGMADITLVFCAYSPQFEPQQIIGHMRFPEG
jgi:hypothetical protein